MRLTKFSLNTCIALLAAGVAPASAQSFITATPRASQHAVTSQRIALTDITITYHRPLVNGRKVWGGIVPFGSVWRAGANENTMIEFSDPVTIEGQPLAKGVYGLHSIPTPESWTIIFSKNATSWGSFTYDQAEDALRITVKPQAGEMHEALAYDFDDVKNDSASVTLRWEKLAVPFHVAVAKEVTLQKIRNQLRDLAQYHWQGWEEAAAYCLQEKINLDEALKWSDHSIQIEERFDNLMTKGGVLEALNRASDATAVRTRAMELGNASQVYFYGRQLQTQKQKAQAISVYRTVAKRFPQHWLGHMAQARAFVADGDFAAAIKEVKAAQSAGVPEAQKANMETLIKRLENKEDING
jgi:tetratricopeptide (TPR) repeat protein